MQTKTTQKLNNILEAVRVLIDTSIPEISEFLGEHLCDDFKLELPTANLLPVVELINLPSTTGHNASKELLESIVSAKNLMAWQQSYTNADGFDNDYLDRYGWFNLISPTGPFVSDKIRISVGYWGEGLFYKQHWHEPAEFYLIIAGQAIFNSQGREPRHCKAGDIVFHKSNQPHSIEMTPGPLLAMAFWKGKNLLAKSGLQDNFGDQY